MASLTISITASAGSHSRSYTFSEAAAGKIVAAARNTFGSELSVTEALDAAFDALAEELRRRVIAYDRAAVVGPAFQKEGGAALR